MLIIKNSSKRVFSTLLALLIVFSVFTVLPITASATCDENGIEYFITDGVAKVSGFTGDKTAIVIPPSVENCPVTTIAEFAFYDCKKIKSITIPDTVDYLGRFAFENCISLEFVDLGKGIRRIDERTFKNCQGLKSFTIPEQIEYIHYDSFVDCVNLTTINFNARKCSSTYGLKQITALTTLNIGPSVEMLPSEAFCKCKSLKNINIEDGLLTLSQNCFYGCTEVTSVTLPESIVAIGELAFEGCTSLETVKFSDNLNIISDSAFRDCSSLDNIMLPKSLRTIGSKAFENCTSLKEIKLNNGLITVGNSAFGGCTALTNITLPNSVSSLGSYVFAYDTSLSDVSLSTKLSCVSEGTFCGCTSLKSVTAPEKIREIGKYAFYNCNKLSKINLNNQIQSIGECAFENCAGFTYIKIPSSVRAIYSYAFAGCKKLKNVTLPNSEIDIYSQAFTNCLSLKEVIIPNKISSLGYCCFGYYGDDNYLYKLPDFKLISNNKTVKYYCDEYGITMYTLPTHVKINDKNLVLGKGEVYNTSAKTSTGSYGNYSLLSWKSSNTKVATVKKISGSKAKIVAKGRGTAYITVQTKNNKSHKIKVTVKNAPKKVAFSKSKMYIRAGHVYYTKVKINNGSYANIKNIKCSSTNKKVANIYKPTNNNKYVVCAYNKGNTYLKVKLYNGKIAKCKVIVQ